ncbi:hypothetical protein H0X48_02850 [Candidatus Dependentiae bacterium]|nr:hypothetical protein [Candidatus Dependentiae bacterium]
MLTVVFRTKLAHYFILLTIFIQSFHHTLANTSLKSPLEHSTTAIFYMAADNDLYPFSERNIRQIRAVIAKFDEQAKKRLKIAIHIDMHRPGQPKITRRYYVDKQQLVQIGKDMSMDSGDPQTLIDCCRWAIESYPADNYVLFLWNHGLGIIEPPIKHAINPSQLFKFNATTRLVELNRSVGFLDYITSTDKPSQSLQKRSICFDDTTGNYLTNQKLKFALETVYHRYLHKKKITICCDACLMAMIEVISPLKDYVDYFISSQEVELGMGYDYTHVFTPFITTSLDKRAFATHVVSSYQQAYNKITQDYTQSAIDLSHFSVIDTKVDQLARLLIEGLQKQKNRSVKETIRLSKHKNLCTNFDEPTYIDYGHFAANMLLNIGRCELKTQSETLHFRQQVTTVLQQTLEAIRSSVIANATGKNLAQAQGLSIYFPENHIHTSYRQSVFATEQTQWYNFLTHYLTH